MASASSGSLATIGDILKDIYMGGPPQPIVKPIEWWPCRKHKYPNYGRYEEYCKFDAECDDLDCPHRTERQIKPPCPECAGKKWIHVLDGETGEPAYEAVFRSGIAWQLEHESLFLNLMLREDVARQRYGELPKHSEGG